VIGKILAGANRFDDRSVAHHVIASTQLKSLLQPYYESS
jgi:hypothetical protein